MVHGSLVAQVLQGTKLMFSRLWPTDVKSQDHHLWQMAERLGAECTTVLDNSVTHVVTNTKSTAKVRHCSLLATLQENINRIASFPRSRTCKAEHSSLLTGAMGDTAREARRVCSMVTPPASPSLSAQEPNCLLLWAGHCRSDANDELTAQVRGDKHSLEPSK